MSATLPARIDPLRLVRQGARLQGVLPASRMPRLSGAVLQAGDAQVELEFGVDIARVHFVRGDVRVRVSMPCQRCLEAMELDLDARVDLGIVISESQIDRLPAEVEPLLVGEDPIDPASLVEDELLLALPLVPRHELADCPAAKVVTGGGDAITPPVTGGAADSTRPNPFAVLAALKQKD